MLRPTYAVIDLEAIKRNVRVLRKHLTSKVAIAVVVKADAYGHGALQVSRAVLKAGAGWLAVAIPEEAVLLREEGIKTPILVLGAVNRSEALLSARLNLRQTVISDECAAYLNEAAKLLNRKVFAHVKVDTGMGRIGLRSKKAFIKVVEYFKRNERIEFEGLFTHFAVSDAGDKEFTAYQAERLQEYVGIARQNGFTPVIHAANSAACIDMPEYAYDMVRPGISIYGYYPSDKVNRESVELTPALKLVTHVSQVKKIGKNDSVSYGRTFIADKETVVATLPVGYADGYNRLLSNKGEVLIRSRRARILGRICMDQFMVDVTHIPEICVKDEAVLIGRQKEAEITVEEIAEHCGTINYEVLTSISGRVPRLYKGGVSNI